MNEHRFDGKSELYAAHRPGYPPELMTYLYTAAGFSAESVIADVGAGTGILTGELLSRGSTVYAVEPNADMRKEATQSLSGNPRFHAVDGTAEHTTLPDRSVDFVTAAQAFHWFDAAAFRAECRRILRPGGEAVLVWNSRDPDSPLTAELIALHRRYCPEFHGFSGGLQGEARDKALADFFADDMEEKAFANPITLDERGFIGRCLSSSYALREGDEHYAAYLDALTALFYKYGDGERITWPNVTDSYRGCV